MLIIKVKYILIFLLLTLATYLFFENPIKSFFSQDDFFHMSLIMDKTYTDLPSFYSGEPNGYYFYRPLSRETYNLLMYNLFGLNSLAFHIINFLLILLNGFLIYKFWGLLTKNKIGIILTLGLYFFSAVHSIELYYLASFQTLLSCAFVLSGLIYYRRFLIEGVNKFWFFSIILFALAMTSHESSITFIGLIFLLELWNLKLNRHKIIKSFFHLMPFLLIAFIRFLIHYFGPGLDPQQNYESSLSIKNIFNTFSWFTLWSFGLPEMLVDFATLTLSFNPNLFKFYGYYTSSVFPLTILIFTCLFLVMLSLLKYNWKDRDLWFLGLSYIVTLSPFLFFPNHKFIYYLSIPILFFCGLIGLLLGKYWILGKSHKFLIITFFIAYLVVSYQTINLNGITHWSAKRAASASFLTEDLENKYTTIPKGSIFYIKNDPSYPFIAKEWGTSSQQAFYILSGPDAFKLIFKDPSIKAYYQDVTGPPRITDNQNLIVYEARFPY